MAGTTVCIRSLEIAFMSDQLKRGSSDFTDKFAFMNFFYETLSAQIHEELELGTWQGVLATNGYDGLEVKMAADVNTLKPTVGNGGIASAVTPSNVIAKFKQARNVVPKAVRGKSDFVYIVAQNVYDALADEVSDNKASGLYYIEGEILKFQGKEVYLAEGASDNLIVACQWSNLLNIQDLLSDEQGFQIVDFYKTTLDRKIGVRTDFKFQPDYVKSNEIYIHNF
jgi:hypothetical protein